MIGPVVAENSGDGRFSHRVADVADASPDVPDDAADVCAADAFAVPYMVADVQPAPSPYRPPYPLAPPPMPVPSTVAPHAVAPAVVVEVPVGEVAFDACC